MRRRNAAPGRGAGGRLLVAVCAAWLLLAGARSLAEASYPETVRLIRTMREDELLLAALQANLPRDMQAGRVSANEASCIALVRYPAVTEPVALMASDVLTGAEISQGIAFFRSDAGQKVADHAIREITQRLPPDDKLSFLTTQEQDELQTFLATPLGRKLLRDRVLRTGTAIRNVRASIRIVPEGCRDAVAVEMDAVASQPFWMAYGDATRCLLSRRVSRSERPAAPLGMGDSIVQFRKLKVAALPFATNELVFFESLSLKEPMRSVRVRTRDGVTKAMTPGSGGFSLIGADAQALAAAAARREAFELDFEPTKRRPFRVSIPPTDLDWAGPRFDACLRTL